MAYFPESVLSYTPFSDLLPSEATSAARWHMLKTKQDKTTAETTEFNTLTTQLANKIFTATTFNSLFDEIIALEEFFNDEVESFIDEKYENFNHKGEWNESTSYVATNIVTKYGCSYMAIQDSTGISPVEKANSIYWGLIASSGIKGDKGDTGNSPIYCGESEPEDENVLVWVDTDGNADVGALPIITSSTDAPSITLANNTCYALGTITSWELTLPAPPDGYTTRIIIGFTTSESVILPDPINLTWAETAPVWEANTSYEVIFHNIGSGWKGFWVKA